MTANTDEARASGGVMSDGKATEAIIALRYWARATNYELTENEKEVLNSCDERAQQMWDCQAR